MYSDKKNILQLVALLEAHGITKVVLCPGSRNAPIVHTFTSHPGFTCYSVTDERSAGYFALGLALQEGEPAAVCCTSGTALLNLHPAVAEAFYQQVPLVVISADRPAAWIGQMDGQTLPQPGVFQTLVKKSVSLSEVHTGEDEWYCNRLVNEALLATVHHVKGPVHINILISEPLFQFTVERLPEVRVIKRCMNTNGLKQLSGKNDLVDILRQYKKRMFVIGQSTVPSPSETENIHVLAESCVFLSEHLGNRPSTGSYLRNFDSLLYALPKTEMDAMAPELLITYGGHIVSKRLKNFLRNHPPREHWHISPDGEVVDLFGCLSTIIEMNPDVFLSELRNNMLPDVSGYPLLWKEKCDGIPEPDFGYSEMSAVGKLMKSLPQESVLHLANSSAVRYAQLFPLPSPSIRVCCNRGTSGIEGSLSTAVGYAAAWNEQLNFIVIGDLSFFYDMNALWNNNYGCNLRVLLLNNSGGEIFHTLPGLDMFGSSHQFVTATHQTSAEGWVKERRFTYLKAENEEQLEKAMELFASPHKQDYPMLMEVFTNKDDDTRILKDYYHQLKTTMTL